MTLPRAIDWLASQGATLSLIGKQLGRIHVRGAVVPNPIAGMIEANRELVSLLLVQEYGWTGDSEVEAVRLASRLRELVRWLRGLPPSATLLVRTDSDSALQNMAVAMLQDMGIDAYEAASLADLLERVTHNKSAA